TLPTQLGFSEAGQALREDVQLRQMFLWSGDRMFFDAVGTSIVHWTYFVLILLAVVSFAVNFPRFPVLRALLVCFFLALSLYQQRAAPFFAIVAAPVIALNSQETMKRYRPLRRRDPLPQFGAAFTFLVLLALFPAAWVGKLHAKGNVRGSD